MSKECWACMPYTVRVCKRMWYAQQVCSCSTLEERVNTLAPPHFHRSVPVGLVFEGWALLHRAVRASRAAICHKPLGPPLRCGRPLIDPPSQHPCFLGCILGSLCLR